MKIRNEDLDHGFLLIFPGRSPYLNMYILFDTVDVNISYSISIAILHSDFGRLTVSKFGSLTGT